MNKKGLWIKSGIALAVSALAIGGIGLLGKKQHKKEGEKAQVENKPRIQLEWRIHWRRGLFVFITVY